MKGFIIGFLCISFYIAAEEQHLDEVAPTCEFHGEYLIMKNLPEEMSEEKNREWVYEILSIFKMNVPKEDIHFEGNTVSIKLPSCCCRPCKPE